MCSLNAPAIIRTSSSAASSATAPRDEGRRRRGSPSILPVASSKASKPSVDRDCQADEHRVSRGGETKLETKETCERPISRTRAEHDVTGLHHRREDLAPEALTGRLALHPECQPLVLSSRDRSTSESLRNSNSS